MKSTPAQGLSRFCQQWLSRSAEIIIMKPGSTQTVSGSSGLPEFSIPAVFIIIIIIILYFHEQLLP